MPRLVQTVRVVDPHAWQRMLQTMLDAQGQVDDVAGVVGESVQVGGGVVAGRRAWTGTEKRTPQNRQEGQRPAEGGVDPAMQSLPLSGAQPVLDLLVSHSQGEKLGSCQDATLVAPKIGSRGALVERYKRGHPINVLSARTFPGRTEPFCGQRKAVRLVWGQRSPRWCRDR